MSRSDQVHKGQRVLLRGWDGLYDRAEVLKVSKGIATVQMADGERVAVPVERLTVDRGRTPASGQGSLF